jgi:hypothetical protein
MFGKLKRFRFADVDEGKMPGESIERPRRRSAEHVVLERGIAPDCTLIKQRR